MSAPPELGSSTLDTVRVAVRGVLESSEAFGRAPASERARIAHKMVRVSMLAAELLEQELRDTPPSEPAPAAPARAPVAQALANPADFGRGARAGTQTLRDAEKAIDFPRFVTSLISGVFQSISNANMSQLEAISDLLDNVSASADEFSTQNIADGAAVSWALQRFPFLAMDGETLVLREDEDLATHRATLERSLDASPGELGKIDPSNLAEGLLPLVRRKLGRDRQTLLGTIVQMGLQRIVVDEGRLHASMDLRVDARSINEQISRDRTDFSISTGASGSFGVGAWGASARMDTSFAKVHAEDNLQRDEVSLRAGLRSSVDLAFRTEQVPLDRMAGPAQRVKLDLNARVPVSVAEQNASLLGEAPKLTTTEIATPARPAATPLPAVPSPDELKKRAAEEKAKKEAEEKAKKEKEEKAKKEAEEKAKKEAEEKAKKEAAAKKAAEAKPG